MTLTARDSAGSKPILTVAIPTWNRARYLALNLSQWRKEAATHGLANVEILVSDNASTDETPAVVAEARHAGLQLTSIRNPENIGSDANIAQCFEMAKGRYVLLLGDDDVLVDGTLAALLSHLESGRYGVVCLKPYGYVSDFEAEYPGGDGAYRVFDDPGPYLAAIRQYVTLISACVINKEILGTLDARAFIGGNLVQVHLALKAAIAAPENLFITRYSVACKRANSGGYDFSKVFVDELWAIFDAHLGPTLTTREIRRVETAFLVGYYPFNLLRQRLAGSEDLIGARQRFVDRFGDRVLFWCWLGPILYAPRPLAILWGSLTTSLGRLAHGDLRRGLTFAGNRFSHRRSSRGTGNVR